MTKGRENLANGEVTDLLERHRDGEPGAFDRLVEIVYRELRVLARSQLRRRRSAFSTTEVVNEAYLKLSSVEKAAWNDRAHFFTVAARAMRHILVDHARSRRRLKRGADAPHVPLDPERLAVLQDADQLLALDQALRRLEARDPVAVRALESRYFGGLTNPETAEALGISVRSVDRGLRRARDWLVHQLDPGGA